MPAICAVIPCYDRPDELVALLADLQCVIGSPADLRILVIDNGSPRPLEPPDCAGLPVQVLRLPVNLGGSGGFNAGMKAALESASPPDCLWLLDSDARLDPDCLRLLQETAQARPDAWAIGPALAERPCMPPHEVGGHVDRRTGRLGPAMPAPRSRPDPRAPFEVDYIASCCALVRADVVARIGLMPDVFLNGDDAEWCVQISRATGRPVLVNPIARAYHPRFDRYPTFARFYQARNGFGVIASLELGRRANFRRALVEVRRALNQALMGRDDLAQLHLDGLRAAANRQRLGAAPVPLRIAPMRKIQEPSSRPRAVRASLLRRLLLGPPTDLAVVPAKGGPDAWLAGNTMILRDQDRELEIHPRWPRPLLRAMLAGISGLRSALALWARPPGTSDLPQVAPGPSHHSAAAAARIDLTIVVLSFNRRDALRVTLRSLQTDEPTRGAQVIVVDNASTDGSAEMVRTEFPAARIIPLDANLGVAGFNRGVAAADGELVLVLDDDARPDVHSLRAGLACLQRRPDLAAIAFLPRHPSTGLGEWPFAEDGLDRERASDQPAREDWPVMGSGNLVRRQAWLDVGGYDERFFLYRNDTDLAMKLLAAGRGVAFSPRWIVWHDSPVARSKTARWCRLATRNWLWLARRHGRGLSRCWGALAGWAWAHRLAGLNLERQWAVVRGATGGLLSRTPRLPVAVTPDGRAFRTLLDLQIGSSLRRSTIRRSIVRPTEPALEPVAPPEPESANGELEPPIVEVRVGQSAAPGVAASASSSSRHSA